MSLEISNEMDVMLAHRRGMQFAKFSGISLSEQTRFATAVSEICRNSLEYAVKGQIFFAVIHNADRLLLEAVIQDKGKGIKDLPEILKRKPEQVKGRGVGIVYAQKLSDIFHITSKASGTTVTIQKNIPVAASLINNLIVKGWVAHLQKEPAISAYEELKIRNVQLMELTEELRQNSLLVSVQMEEIKTLNAQLSDSNDRMKEFTYAISHDLKTPLTSLKISSAFLQENSEGLEVPVYKAILQRSVNRLDKTIHSLIEILDMQNKDKQVIRNVYFASIFREAIEEYQQNIKDTGAVIKTRFEASTIDYIEIYLQSLMHNLLSNSLKYRDPQRPLIIEVETLPASGGAKLIFKDTGTGMDLNLIRNRLFQPFNRFSSLQEGKGIGLYLVKGMVESNGGTVKVDSTPGEGTTFTFNLIRY